MATTAREWLSIQPYLRDPAARKLADFFEQKGLARLKREDKGELWYDDWLSYQSEHQLYASVLSPKQFSSAGRQFDLLRYARYMEFFAYFSAGHAYSMQVTFLGFFSILMGSNDALKKEAVRTLEAGGLFAFGVSEEEHGSDLLANEFIVRPTSPGRFIANGRKYYIGNANCASIISILGRNDEAHSDGTLSKRAPFVLFALRPKQSKAFGNLRKINTLGVRAGFVGEFDVKEHAFPETDLIAEGRRAWDAVLGTVTLGKFFLGFGSIGICEHAFEEAVAHLKQRILYGKPVIEMPHIRSTIAQACARLTAMKLYAYRALDYVHAARAEDRRYLLYCAVQKAKVSTEGVKVMAVLSECIGARGFESDDTFFEMALRDAQLIPGLESSAHINLGLTAQFMTRYFSRPDPNLAEPKSVNCGEQESIENPYLMEPHLHAINAIAFPPFLRAYTPLMNIANVRLFTRQAKAFRLFLRTIHSRRALITQTTLALGQCVATIAYGQLIAENAVRLAVAPEVVSAIFHLLVSDISASALALASLPELDTVSRFLIRRVITVPRTTSTDWNFVADQCS